MRQIRFSGLVRLANGVQRELSGGVRPERREQLRSQVLRTVELVEKTLSIHGASARAIPGPTRRAYEFLRTIDFNQVRTASDTQEVERRQYVSLSGLTARVEFFADQLAEPVIQAQAVGDDRLENMRRLLLRIDRSNERAGMRSEHFTQRSREHLAWLRFLADPDNYADYLDAHRRATAVFDRVAPPDRWPRPIVVHFRPTQSVYRVRAADSRTRVLLPTPMITLDAAGFTALAGAIFCRRSGRRGNMLHELLMAEPYQELQAELEALGGMVEDTCGMAHDLSESFDRVNAAYFAAAMQRPRLTWNRTITVGKFGHYNYSTDTVMISRTLDHPRVPAFVVDHVMHHELLHKKHGLRWHQGRGHAHTAEFRQDERQFAQFLESDEFLKRLATR